MKSISKHFFYMVILAIIMFGCSSNKESLQPIDEHDLRFYWDIDGIKKYMAGKYTDYEISQNDTGKAYEITFAPVIFRDLKGVLVYTPKPGVPIAQYIFKLPNYVYNIFSDTVKGMSLLPELTKSTPNIHYELRKYFAENFQWEDSSFFLYSKDTLHNSLNFHSQNTRITLLYNVPRGIGIFFDTILEKKGTLWDKK